MAKKKVPDLKIENIDDFSNVLFLSLVEYKREQYLCIIDSINSSEVSVYVLDYAEQQQIDIKTFLSFTTYWFYSNSEHFPLSIHLARNGLTEWAAPIFRTFDTAYVSRIIGRAFYIMSEQKTKVKRRRVIPLPEGIEIKFKKLA